MENQPQAASIALDKVHHLKTSFAKAQKVVEIAESKVVWHRDELRQSSDRQTGVRAQA